MKIRTRASMRTTRQGKSIRSGLAPIAAMQVPREQTKTRAWPSRAFWIAVVLSSHVFCNFACADPVPAAPPAPASAPVATNPPPKLRPMKNGDTIILLSEVRAHDVNANRDVKAPGQSAFSFIWAEGPDGNAVIHVVSRNRKRCGPPWGWVPDWLLSLGGSNPDNGYCSFNNKDPGEVHRNQPYTINERDLVESRYISQGWRSGVLVVPYKYVPANHDLAKGNVTLGPYFGYTTSWFGTETTVAFSAGLTQVAIPSVQNGVATNTTKQGVTVAGGLLFNVDGVSSGVLIGVDQLGQNSGYQNNGKLWIGIFVGGAFSSNSSR